MQRRETREEARRGKNRDEGECTTAMNECSGHEKEEGRRDESRLRGVHVRRAYKEKGNMSGVCTSGMM